MIKKLLAQPHTIFWLLVLLMILLGFLLGDITFDINIHDTYYVFTLAHFSLLWAIIFFFVGASYWVISLFKKQIPKTLIIVHVIGSIFCLLCMYYSIISTIHFQNTVELSEQSLLQLSNYYFFPFAIICLVLLQVSCPILSLIIVALKKSRS